MHASSMHLREWTSILAVASKRTIILPQASCDAVLASVGRRGDDQNSRHSGEIEVRTRGWMVGGVCEAANKRNARST